MALPSVTCKVPDTAVVCALGVRLVVAPLVIDGLPNALANGLAKESVALSGSLATKEIDVALTARLEIVGAFTGVVVTTILKVSLAARLPRSVAETLTLSVPTFAAVGVPLNVRVAALKLSQAGSAEPSAAVAV